MRATRILAAVFVCGCAPGGPAEDTRSVNALSVLVQSDTIPGLPAWTKTDWETLRSRVSWAWEHGIDSLPIGGRVARIGETFVGVPYQPRTLDPPGSERLVINLRALDCVTYVENMFALAHFVRSEPRDILDRPEEAMRRYQELVTRLRYRDGELSTYPSRLHYFSEWLSNNEGKGIVALVTHELGGVVDTEPISFMTEHADAYHQLADEEFYSEISRIEKRLSEVARHYIPQSQVATVADRIRTGDVIAATSTLTGLDVAHTGIALWQNDVLRLMHAPLVGRSVEISALPLAERLLGIETQDGVMVARPLEGGM